MFLNHSFLTLTKKRWQRSFYLCTILSIRTACTWQYQGGRVDKGRPATDFADRCLPHATAGLSVEWI